MFKRNNRKGFTLAELLIVVAIIAVLVAIAVPLFVGALNDAEKRVGEANIRAVRGAAVVKILGDQATYIDVDPYKTNGKWYATADVSADGEVSNLKVSGAETPAASLTNYTKTASGQGAWLRESTGAYKVYVILSKTDLSST